MEADGTNPGTTGGSFAAWTTSDAGTQTQAAELLSTWQPAGQAPQSIAAQVFSAFDAAWEGLIRSWQDALASRSPGAGVATDAFAASASGLGLNMSPVVLSSPADTRAGTGIELTLPQATATFSQ